MNFNTTSFHRRLFFVLLVLLPTQLGYHMWPSWSIVLGRRIDYLSPTLYLTDLLIMGVLLSWVLRRAPRNGRDQGSRKAVSQQKRFLPMRTILYIGAAGAFIAFNIFFAKRPPVAMYAWLKMLELILLGWYIVRAKPDFPTVVMGLSVGLFYSSFVAIVQFVFQHSIGGPLWWLGERSFSLSTPGIARLSWCLMPFVESCKETLRVYGTFSHPNVLGGYNAALLPIIVFQILFGKLSYRTRSFYIGTCFIGLLALVLTFSRSAWVGFGFGIGILYYFFISKKRIIGRNILLFLILLFAFFTALSLPVRTDESVVLRASLNQSASTLWSRSPLLGVGLGNFTDALPDVTHVRQANSLQPVHNIYLLVLSETGVAGFIFFVVFVGLLVWEEVAGLSQKKQQPSIYVIPLICLLLLGLVDHYSLTLQQGQLLFVVVIASVLSKRSV